jgi:hypothetical protein
MMLIRPVHVTMCAPTRRTPTPTRYRPGSPSSDLLSIIIATPKMPTSNALRLAVGIAALTAPAIHSLTDAME